MKINKLATITNFQYFLLLATFLAFSACSNQEKSFDELCDGITNYYECSKIIEAHQIPKFKDYVLRNGDTLTLELNDGISKKLIKERSDPSLNKLYTFRRLYKSLKLFELAVHYYEGGEFLLISGDNGKSTKVFGEIIMSPDSTRVLSYKNSVDGLGSNGFQIFKITKDSLTKEIEFKPNEWGPENPKWTDNKTITCDKYGFNNGDFSIYSTTTFVFQDDRWKEMN